MHLPTTSRENLPYIACPLLPLSLHSPTTKPLPLLCILGFILSASMAADQVLNKEEDGAFKVIVHAKSHIMPTKKLGRRECQLVTFDLPYLAFYYNQKLLLYNGSDFEGMVGKLKDGLRVVLEEFYQLAGRLEKDADGVFKVVYDDDMDGVEVLEASADQISVSDLTDVESPSMIKDLMPYSQVLNVEGLHRPLLVFQVTPIHFINSFISYLFIFYWIFSLGMP